MSFLFKSVLYASFMGSIVAIILILLKAVFKDKLKASWHYCIWFFLLIRLILPYAPESRVSIYNLFPHVTQSIHVSQIDKIPETDVKPYTENAPVQNSAITQDMNSGTNKSEVEKTLTKNTAIEKYSVDNYIDIISIVWMVVAGIMLLYIFVLNMGFYLTIKKNALCKDKNILDILEECKSLFNVKASIPIIYYKDNKPPFLLGIFKPKLIIPSVIFDKLSEQEKRHIFLHEIAHFKRMDILVNSIMLVVKSIHWFNPIIWYACRRMQEDCEIACDASVLSCLKPDEYKKYGETAINLLTKFSRPYLIPGTAGISGNGTGIKRRIHMITRFRKNSLTWALLAMVLFLIVGVVVLTNPNQANGLIPIDRLINKPSASADVEGEGIVVTLMDRPGVELEADGDKKYSGYINNIDIREIIGQLRLVGAYAVSVNDVRLTEYSQIVGEEMFINVDDNKLGPPFVIKALGNSNVMEKRLNEEGGIVDYMEFRGTKITIEKVQNLHIQKQGEAERILHANRVAIAKNLDLTKEPDEGSIFKEYYSFGFFYGFWTCPYVIYNNQKYEILVQDSIPKDKTGEMLGSVKSYIDFTGGVLFGFSDSSGVELPTLINSDGYSNYLRKFARIYKLKWNSDSKIIVVDDNGVLKRAVIVKK